jgi:hypothetical protein
MAGKLAQRFSKKIAPRNHITAHSLHGNKCFAKRLFYHLLDYNLMCTPDDCRKNQN